MVRNKYVQVIIYYDTETAFKGPINSSFASYIDKRYTDTRSTYIVWYPNTGFKGIVNPARHSAHDCLGSNDTSKTTDFCTKTNFYKISLFKY